MKKNRCVNCGQDFLAGYRSNVCGECESPKEFGFPRLVQVEILLKGIPGETKMTRAEINEVRRNVAVPIGNGKIKCGRMGDNGKIEERSIKYEG